MHIIHNEKQEKRNNERNRIRKASEYLKKKENYKYLGIMEADTIKQREIKQKDSVV